MIETSKTIWAKKNYYANVWNSDIFQASSQNKINHLNTENFVKRYRSDHENKKKTKVYKHGTVQKFLKWRTEKEKSLSKNVNFNKKKFYKFHYTMGSNERKNEKTGPSRTLPLNNYIKSLWQHNDQCILKGFVEYEDIRKYQTKKKQEF